MVPLGLIELILLFYQIDKTWHVSLFPPLIFKHWLSKKFFKLDSFFSVVFCSVFSKGIIFNHGLWRTELFQTYNHFPLSSKLAKCFSLTPCRCPGIPNRANAPLRDLEIWKDKYPNKTKDSGETLKIFIVCKIFTKTGGIVYTALLLVQQYEGESLRSCLFEFFLSLTEDVATVEFKLQWTNIHTVVCKV